MNIIINNTMIQTVIRRFVEFLRVDTHDWEITRYV